MSGIQKSYQILSNEKLTACFYRLKIDATPIIKKFSPGMFINIKVGEGLEPFFRRPFSIFRVKNGVEILYDVVGKGTTLLSQKVKGEVVDVLGPLGKGFDLPPSGTKQIVFIAGGVGVAPFLGLSDELKKLKREMILLYGVRKKEHVFDLKEFEKNGCQVFITSEDGSVGIKGRVDKLFSKITVAPTTFVYTCGPNPMMAAVQAFARQQGLKGQASCEATMACGIGTCLGCVIQTTSGYKTVCHDGPVFDLQEIIFRKTG